MQHSQSSPNSTNWEKKNCDTIALPPSMVVKRGPYTRFAGYCIPCMIEVHDQRGRLVTDRIRVWQEGVRALVRARCCALHHVRVRLTPWHPMVALGYTHVHQRPLALGHQRCHVHRALAR